MKIETTNEKELISEKTGEEKQKQIGIEDEKVIVEENINNDNKISDVEELKNEIKAEVKEEIKKDVLDEDTNTKKRSKLARIISAIFRMLGIIIILIAVYIVVRVVCFKRTDIAGMRFYMIMSGSMEPTINASDAVVTKEMDDYNKDDVIAFEVHNSTTIHRIIKVYTEDGKKLYQTQGDNNNTPDKELITNENIKGKVLFKLPQLSNVLLFLQKNVILIIGGLCIIVMLYIVIRRLI